MEQEYRHAIALMRYSAIAPLIPGLPEGLADLVKAGGHHQGIALLGPVDFDGRDSVFVHGVK